MPVSPTLSDQEVLDLTMTDFMSYLLEGKVDVPPSPHHTSDAALVESSEEEEQGADSSRGASPNHGAAMTPSKRTTATSKTGRRSARRGGSEPNRNARMAKENRERKKAYVNDLEQQLAATKREKDEVASEKADLEAELAEAHAEIAQLRRSLATAPAIAQVLEALGAASAFSFNGQPPAPVAGRKRAAHEDEDESAGVGRREFGRGKRRASSRGVAKAMPDATPKPTVIPLQLNLHVHAQ